MWVLAGLALWIERWPADLRVPSSEFHLILVKSKYLGCRLLPSPGPCRVCAEGNQSMCLSHVNISCFSLFSTLSKKSMEKYPWVRIKEKKKKKSKMWAPVGWLVHWRVILYSKRLWLPFLVSAHTYLRCGFDPWGVYMKIDISFSFPSSFSLSKNQ
uniref:Uncharacterized protein n=1 Tax=Pipistrellus kuhlii TaxID=59472 RepID=A0A7J7WDG0_PIPKU|nr:hypothetical protein mPipKuh1_008059 [Pipistrellus kuhlii]